MSALRARDPERTKERILAAAVKEFSAKGLAGARVDAIAARAKVNKRMLYHYFGSKSGLFAEILRRRMGARDAQLERAPEDPAERLVYYHQLMCDDVEGLRLLQWEALTGGRRRLVNEDERRRFLARAVETVRRQQREGLVIDDLDPEQLTLSIVALVAFPLILPQFTRLVTGLDPSDPQFRKNRAEFLRRLGERLKPPSSEASSPEAPSSEAASSEPSLPSQASSAEAQPIPTDPTDPDSEARS